MSNGFGLPRPYALTTTEQRCEVRRSYRAMRTYDHYSIDLARMYAVRGAVAFIADVVVETHA